MPDIIQNIAAQIIAEAANRLTGNESLIRGIYLVHYQVNLRLLEAIREEEEKVAVAARLRKEVGGE